MELLPIYMEGFFINIVLPAGFIAGLVWAYLSIKKGWGIMEAIVGLFFSIILIYPIWYFWFAK